MAGVQQVEAAAGGHHGSAVVPHPAGQQQRLGGAVPAACPGAGGVPASDATPPAARKSAASWTARRRHPRGRCRPGGARRGWQPACRPAPQGSATSTRGAGTGRGVRSRSRSSSGPVFPRGDQDGAAVPLRPAGCRPLRRPRPPRAALPGPAARMPAAWCASARFGVTTATPGTGCGPDGCGSQTIGTSSGEPREQFPQLRVGGQAPAVVGHDDGAGLLHRPQHGRGHLRTAGLPQPSSKRTTGWVPARTRVLTGVGEPPGRPPPASRRAQPPAAARRRRRPGPSPG